MYTIYHKPMPETKMIEFSLENVDQLYEGKGNSCRCGCNGEYYSAEEYPDKIQAVLEKMASNKYEVTSIADYIFEIEVNKERNIVQTIYLKQTK